MVLISTGPVHLSAAGRINKTGGLADGFTYDVVTVTMTAVETLSRVEILTLNSPVPSGEAESHFATLTSTLNLNSTKSE